MPFDLATATPVEDSAGGGFDLASAKPIKRLSPAERARIEAETAAWQQSVSPTADMNAFQRFAAAYGKVGADIALGMRSVLPESIGGTKPGEVAERKRLDEPLMRTPAGAIGNVAGNLAAYAPMAALPGANTVAGAAGYGALAGVLQPAENWSERGGNAMTSAAMSGGLTSAVKSAPTLMRALGSGGELVRPTAENNAVQSAIESGLHVTPTQARPGNLLAQITEGFSGSAKTSL